MGAKQQHRFGWCLDRERQLSSAADVRTRTIHTHYTLTNLCNLSTASAIHIKQQSMLLRGEIDRSFIADFLFPLKPIDPKIDDLSVLRPGSIRHTRHGVLVFQRFGA